MGKRTAEVVIWALSLPFLLVMLPLIAAWNIKRKIPVFAGVVVVCAMMASPALADIYFKEQNATGSSINDGSTHYWGQGIGPPNASGSNISLRAFRNANNLNTYNFNITFCKLDAAQVCSVVVEEFSNIALAGGAKAIINGTAKWNITDSIGVYVRGFNPSVDLNAEWDATNSNAYANGSYYECTLTTALSACNPITTVDMTFQAVFNDGPLAPPAGSNLTITAADLPTLAALSSFNVTLSNSTRSFRYSTTTGSISANVTNGTYNISVDSPWHFTNTTLNIDASTAFKANLTPWMAVQARDEYDDTPLGSFNVSYAGVNYRSNSSFSNLSFIPVYSGTSASINVTSSGYFNQTITITANANVSVWQAVGTFQATQLHTGILVQNANFSAGNQKNTTMFLRVPSTSVTAQHSEFYNNTQTISVASLTNTSYVISNLTNLLVNFSLRTIFTGVIVSNFTIIAQYGNVTINVSTTNGTAYFPMANVTYNLTAMARNSYETGGGFSDQYATVQFNNTATRTAQYQFLVYNVNSFIIRIYDEDNNALVANGTPFTISFIGQNNSFQRTTTNGSLNVDLVTPDSYEIQYDGFSIYPKRSYFAVLTNNSFANITLYALNATRSTQTVATILDKANDNRLEGVIIKMLRFYPTDGVFRIVAMARTNNLGTAPLGLVRVGTVYAGEQYKFIVEVNGTTKLTTNSGYVTSDFTYKLLLIDDYLDSYRGIYGVNNIYSNLSFNLSGAPNTFVYTWSDPSGLIEQACMEVFRLTNYGKVVISDACTSGSAGSIQRTVNATGRVIAQVTLDTTTVNSEYVEDQLEIDFDNTAALNLGMRGIFYQFLITIFLSLALVFVAEGAGIFIGVGLSFVVGFFLNLMSWPWLVLSGLLLLIGIIVWRQR